jgi:hypothetical protein
MVVMDGGAMDGQLDRSLREQEHRLRQTIAVLSRVLLDAGTLGAIEWTGQASAAYETAIGALRLELRAAEAHLNGALRDTISAITVGELGG